MKYDELLRYISLFLRQHLLFIPRGGILPSGVEDHIPASWVSLLSTEMALDSAIVELWKQVSAQNLISALTQQTSDIGLLMSKGSIAPLGLLYISIKPKTGYIQSWLGGLPATIADFHTCSTRLGIELPGSYQEFASVHNGFNLDGNRGHGFWSLQKLQFHNSGNGNLADISTPLLPFCSDGAGNIQCYHLEMPKGAGDFLSVDWDHETHEASRPQEFWEFTTRFIATQVS